MNRSTATLTAIGLLILVSILLISKCNSKPTPIIFYYDSNHEVVKNLKSAITLDTNLEITTECLNNLAAKLELEESFSFEKIQDIKDRDHEDFFAEIAKNNCDTIRVYLIPKINFAKGSYSPFNKFISIPILYHYDPGVLLHEISHKLLMDKAANIETPMPHTDFINIGINNCKLEKNNPCVNLMFENYRSLPFNFLLTPSQQRWIKNRKVDSDCQNFHSYPKDLISNNIEEEIGCCNGPTAVDKQILSNIYGYQLTDDKFNYIVYAHSRLVGNICYSDYDETNINELVDVLNSINLQDDFIDEFNLALNNTEFSSSKLYNYKVIAAHLLIWDKTYQCRGEKNLKLFSLEAKYLLESTSVKNNSKHFSMLKRNTCETELFLLKQNLYDYLEKEKLASDLIILEIEPLVIEPIFLPMFNITTDTIKSR